MDDDLSICHDGKNVGVRHECQCAGALKLAKCTEWPAVYSHAKPQRTSAKPQLLIIILLTAGLSRGLRSELSYYFSDNSTVYVHSDLIVELFSNSYIYSRLVICLSNYDSAYATVNLVQSLGRVIFPS